MKKEFRIKKTKEIEQIINAQNSISNQSLRFFCKKNQETSHFRYAISVGKKIGNAVERNLQKRRLRSLFQKYQALIPSDLDIFVIAKPKVAKQEFFELEKDFVYLLKKIIKTKE